MDGSFEITLQIILAVLAGVSAQVLAEFLKVPGIVFLMLFGIALGPDGLSLLHPTLLGAGLEVIVALLVAIILFEGGLSLALRDLGRVSGSLRNLVTIGTLITLVGGGLAAHWFSEFPWSIAFLYASLVVVTGPTVISPLLKQVQVDRRLATLLEGEGVLIDPVGAILAVVVLNITLSGDTDLLSIVGNLAIRLGIGIVIGGLGGSLMAVILRYAGFLSEDLKNLVILSGVWGLYGLAQLVRSESGLLATVIAGIVVSNSLPSIEQRPLRRFKGQLTILAISFLFILLAADLSIDSLFALGWGSGVTVLMLMFVVRPVNIFACTWNSGMNWQQKLFLSWIAPRGIVSASIASLFAILLAERGVNGGDAIKALVFATIILTVFFQGLTARWVANWLRVTAGQATGIVIAGCNPLSILIARQFRERGEPVVLIDTNPDASYLAEKESLPIFVSSALDTEVLEKAGLSFLGTFLAMTNNGEVNLVLAQRAAEEFSPPRVLAVFPKDPQASAPSSGSKVQQAFVSQFPIKTWSQYLLDDAVRLGETILRSDEEELAAQQDHLKELMQAGTMTPLVVERQNHLYIALAKPDWQAGDRLIYLLHEPKSKLMKLLSGQALPKLTIEKIPQIETIPALEPVVELPIEPPLVETAANGEEATPEIPDDSALSDGMASDLDSRLDSAAEAQEPLEFEENLTKRLAN